MDGTVTTDRREILRYLPDFMDQLWSLGSRMTHKMFRMRARNSINLSRDDKKQDIELLRGEFDEARLRKYLLTLYLLLYRFYQTKKIK